MVASGAKPFEQYFAEAFLDPGDGVLVFSPHFPTYVPNLERRRRGRCWCRFEVEHAFRPRAEDVEHFLATDPRPRAIFLNSPHNPTGGVATREDLAAIADVVRGTELMVFSDEPYCHMVWEGRHASILAEPGMLEHTVAAYTFSKSYSMSGWRIGFAVAHPEVVEAIGKLINTTASCTPPLAQWAAAGGARERRGHPRRLHGPVPPQGRAALRRADERRRAPRGPARRHVLRLPRRPPVCNRLGITSHGLALYLLEGADDDFGVACLGGECFGDAGRGFLRFSCAEPDERIDQAIAFLPRALARTDRVRQYLEANPQFILRGYPVKTVTLWPRLSAGVQHLHRAKRSGS